LLPRDDDVFLVWLAHNGADGIRVVRLALGVIGVGATRVDQ